MRMVDNNIRKGGVEWSHLATFLVEKAVNVPLDVVVALLSASRPSLARTERAAATAAAK